MFRRAKSSAGINNINTKELGAISLTVPSLPEQDEIVHIINEMMDKDQQSKEAAEAVLDQIDLMKNPFSPVPFAVNWVRMTRTRRARWNC